MAYHPFRSVRWRDLLQRHVELPLLVRLLGIPAQQRLLEVGCGRGVALGPLARLCRPVSLVGLEIDAAALAEAARRTRAASVAASLCLGDLRDLPFADRSFDLVIDFGTCYHLANPARALAEVARVLRPGGLFVHETHLQQFLAHPRRTRGRRLPWAATPSLAPHRRTPLWASRIKR